MLTHLRISALHPSPHLAGTATPQAPGVSLVRLLEELPAAEAAHLAPDRAPPASDRARDASDRAPPRRRPAFHLAYALTADGTAACQLSACSALVQWPYLGDASLASSLASIFLPHWGRPQPPLGQALMLRRWPWLYFNVLLRDSQLFVPALSPHLPPAPLAGADVLPTLWGDFRRLLLRQVAVLADPEGGDEGRLEASGLALTFGARPGSGCCRPLRSAGWAPPLRCTAGVCPAAHKQRHGFLRSPPDRRTALIRDEPPSQRAQPPPWP